MPATVAREESKEDPIEEDLTCPEVVRGDLAEEALGGTLEGALA